MLFRKLIFILFFASTATFGNDICLFDLNSNGIFSGGDEIRECEEGYDVNGGQVDYCPIGNVPCNIIMGNPICPIDPSYACSQSSLSEPFTCKSIPPLEPVPADLNIGYDFYDDAYIINSPDRESCVRPIIESCLVPVPKACVPAVIDPDTLLEITPGYCEEPDSCKETQTWNPISEIYDSEIVCIEPDLCQEVCVIDTDTGIKTCSIVCPSAPPCTIDPTSLEGSNTCPSDGSLTCTAPSKGANETACSITPDIIPSPCHLEYDQSDEAHIVCDERRATCQFHAGSYGCPFNSSSSACTRTNETSPYTCHVQEETCKSTSGVTTVHPGTPPPFPNTTNNEDIQGDGTCAGDIQIFTGEEFSCHTAGVRVRWDNCCTNGNHIIDDAVDNYLDGAVSMAEMITDLIGSDTISKIVNKLLTLSPDYMVAEAIAEVGNYLLTPCADDSLTASMIATGRCATVGTRCVESLLGHCLQEKQIECCFASKLARIINQQARPQLGLTFGTTSIPDCRGLSPEEFQSIDFSQIDLSEYISDLNIKSQSTIDSEIGESVEDDLIRISSGG